MHQGVFKGNNLVENCNILILGESHHHTEKNDINYTTEKVVKDYFCNPNDRDYKFFDKIAACFGYLEKDRETFWNKVYFGNYVDESDCGIKTDRAKKLIEQNNQMYNKKLFEFVNQNEIDIIFCFSRLVYKQFPLRHKSVYFEVPKTGKKSDWINRVVYKPGIRLVGDTVLKKNLTVYGFRHPSARCGFCSEHYKNYLQKEIQV